MHSGDDEHQDQQRELSKLRGELAELKGSIPVHSMKPSMMQRIEELQEQIERLQQEMRSEQ